jgi:hypothetical protein
MYLVPDLDTFAVIPWDMDLSTARVICDVYTPDGEPFEGDPRYVLKRQLQQATELGLEYQVGPELELRHMIKPAILMSARIRLTMCAARWSIHCKPWASASKPRTTR